MITVTTDYELVTAIWRSVAVDLIDDSTEFAPADESMIHLLAADERTLGVISVHQRFGRCWGIHIAFVPGRRASVRQALLESIQWLKQFTNAKCLMAMFDARDIRLKATARVLGLRHMGALPNAIDRDGGVDAQVWVRAL